MGRPLRKMNKEKLQFIIDNSGKFSTTQIGKQLDLDHTTVMYYQNKLHKAGFKITKSPIGGQSEADKLIQELKSQL